MKDKSMINMAGTSMGSGVKMCGSQVGKHMKMGGPKMMGGDEKKVKNKIQVNKNKDALDKLTHKGFTDFQYGVSKKNKEDTSIFGSYNSGQTTAKIVAMKTGGWGKEMQRSLEDVESKHLKGSVSKNFYQGYKDVMSKTGIKTKAHQNWEATNYKNRFVLSK